MVEYTQAVEVCLLGQKELLWAHFTCIGVDGHIASVAGLKWGNRLVFSHEGAILYTTWAGPDACACS